ncbi:nitroreductase family protein [Anthocerotibacter panamensis]|uniref:nitroreductase family protein n=1 Tax=Anthocerotibacter panamensis TaxID=2857077 RepID=UPI001C40402B|nr:nitroreductase family protein [Anthocerotibacter panamensis]
MVAKSKLGLGELIATRRDALSFKPEAILEGTLQEILKLSALAPSELNLQPTRFILVRTPQGKAKLHECAFRHRSILQAPVTVIACGDSRVENPHYLDAVMALERTPLDNTSLHQAVSQLFSYKPSFGSLEVWVNRQVMLTVAHLLLAAQSVGVDSCLLQSFVQGHVQRAFGLPEEVFVCALIPLGYANPPLKQFGGHFDLNKVVYEEQFSAHLEGFLP